MPTKEEEGRKCIDKIKRKIFRYHTIFIRSIRPVSDTINR